MSSHKDIKKLLAIYTRRLQKLKERKALKGANTEPEILIEIEDIEFEIEKLQIGLQGLERQPQHLFDSYPDIQTISPQPLKTEGSSRLIKEKREEFITQTLLHL